MAFLVLLLLVATSSTAFSIPTSDTLHAHSDCPGSLTHTEHSTLVPGYTFGPLCGPASPRTRTRRPLYRHGLAWLLSFWFQPRGGGSGSDNRSTVDPCPCWDCPSQASGVPTQLPTSQPSNHAETSDRGQPLTPVPHSPGPPPAEPWVSGPKPHVDAPQVHLCLWPSAPLPVPGQPAGRGCYIVEEEDILPVLTRAVPYLGPGSLPDSQPQPPPQREERVPSVQPALQPASQMGGRETDQKQQPGPKGRPVPDADWKHPRPPAQARLHILLLRPEQSRWWWSKEAMAGFCKGRHSNASISVPGTLESVVLLLMGHWAEVLAGPWAGTTFHLTRSGSVTPGGIIFLFRLILERRKVPAEQEPRVVAGREGCGHIPGEPLALSIEESLTELQRLQERYCELEWEVEALQQQELCKQEVEVLAIKRVLECLLSEVS